MFLFSLFFFHPSILHLSGLISSANTLFYPSGLLRRVTVFLILCNHSFPAALSALCHLPSLLFLFIIHFSVHSFLPSSPSSPLPSLFLFLIFPPQIWSKAGCTGWTLSCTCSVVSTWTETTGRKCSSLQTTWLIPSLSLCLRYCCSLYSLCTFTHKQEGTLWS